MDFTYFYKQKISKPEDLTARGEYDVFLTCFGKSERTETVMKNIKTKETHLFLLSDYHETDFKDATIKNFKITHGEEEAVLFTAYFDQSGLTPGLKICIDITGFFIPHLLFLLYLLRSKGITKFDAIYAEPSAYKQKEETTFSKYYNKARQIQGYEGVHDPDVSNDILIIGSGYDNARIIDISNEKLEARKVQLFGFPSLQPDMYQESILNAYKAEAAVGGDRFLDSAKTLYAPANDPFVAAQAISDFIDKEHAKKPITNLYFSPISTKPHALAFALYFLWKPNQPTSIIYPFCEEHLSATSTGLGKIFTYSVELPEII